MKKFLLKISKFFNGEYRSKISQEERYLMIIVNKLLSQKDSDPLMTPMLNKIYICSEDKNIFVVVDFKNNSASIINHHFGYDIRISSRVCEYIWNKFMDEVEKRRNEMEDTYRGNIQYSLSNVIHNIKTNEDEETVDCK